MKIINSAKKAIFKAGRKLKNASPIILTAVAMVGVVATVVEAIRATPKAVEMAEEAKAETESEKIPVGKIVKIVYKCYMPTIGLGVCTLASMYGATALSRRQIASLMSGYAVLNESYKTYRGKVEELLGKDGEAEIRREIVKDDLKNAKPEVRNDDLPLICLSFLSDEPFNATLDAVKDAEYALNRLFSERGIVSVNDFLTMLKRPRVYWGDEAGWDEYINQAYYDINWIDFVHEEVVTDDGLHCVYVSTVIEPEPFCLHDA